MADPTPPWTVHESDGFPYWYSDPDLGGDGSTTWENPDLPAAADEQQHSSRTERMMPALLFPAPAKRTLWETHSCMRLPVEASWNLIRFLWT